MEKTTAGKRAGIRLPVSAKLIAGFGVALLLSVVAGVMSIARLGSLDSGAQEIFEVEDVSHKIVELRESGHLGAVDLLLLADVEDNWNVFLLELEEVLLDEEEGLTFAAGFAVLEGEGEGEGEEAFALFAEELKELAHNIEAAAAHSAEQAHSMYASSRTIILALMIMAAAVGLGVAGYLSWTISKGTRRIAETLRSLESEEITSLEGASGPRPRAT